MKLTLAISIVVLCTIVAMSCPKGTIDYQGICADMPSADTETLAPAVGVVSDEKPPRHPEPAYERGEVTVDNLQSKIYEDSKMDQEKAQADADGKKAAGLK